MSFFFNLQELEIVMGDQHISFTTSKIGSLIDVNQCKYVFSYSYTKQEPVIYPNPFCFSTGPIWNLEEKLLVNDGVPNHLNRFSIEHC